MIIETLLDPIEEGGSFFMKYESDDPSKALLQNIIDFQTASIFGGGFFFLRMVVFLWNIFE